MNLLNGWPLRNEVATLCTKHICAATHKTILRQVSLFAHECIATSTGRSPCQKLTSLPPALPNYRTRRASNSPPGGVSALSYSGSASEVGIGHINSSSDARESGVLYPPAIAGAGNGRVGVQLTPHKGAKHSRTTGEAKAEGQMAHGGALRGNVSTSAPLRTSNAAGVELGGRPTGNNTVLLDDDGDLEPAVPEETFLESLHLDRDQLADFSNSEGHFLYLRQKSGTDATAYNLEVRLCELHGFQAASHVPDSSRSTCRRFCRSHSHVQQIFSC